KARPEEREMRYLTDAQVKQFLAAARQNRLYALFALAVGSGMRQGELLGLAWTDVDFDRATVTVQRSLAQIKGEVILKEPKSKRSRRTVKLPRFAIDALHEHRKAMVAEGNVAAPVFSTRNGTHIAKTNLIRKVHKPLIRKANADAVEAAKKTGGEPA